MKKLSPTELKLFRRIKDDDWLETGFTFTEFVLLSVEMHQIYVSFVAVASAWRLIARATVFFYSCVNIK